MRRQSKTDETDLSLVMPKIKILRVAPRLKNVGGGQQANDDLFLGMCIKAVKTKLTTSCKVTTISLEGRNVVRRDFEQALEDPEIAGVDFYGHGESDSLLGSDGKPLLDSSNIHLLAGKGLDILACGQGPNDFGGLAIRAGAQFVLSYVDLVYTFSRLPFVTAMTTAKLRLYDRKNPGTAYVAQQTAMKDLASSIGLLRPDISIALQFNLRCYKLLL